MKDGNKDVFNPDLDLIMDIQEDAETEEELILVEDEIELLENTESLIATIKEHGITPGIESLVGESAKQFFGVFDAEDIEGTISALETGCEELSVKVEKRLTKLVRNLSKKIIKFEKRLAKDADKIEDKLHVLGNASSIYWYVSDTESTMVTDLRDLSSIGRDKTYSRAYDIIKSAIDGKVIVDAVKDAVLMNKVDIKAFKKGIKKTRRWTMLGSSFGPGQALVFVRNTMKTIPSILNPMFNDMAGQKEITNTSKISETDSVEVYKIASGASKRVLAYFQAWQSTYYNASILLNKLEAE